MTIKATVKMPGGIIWADDFERIDNIDNVKLDDMLELEPVEYFPADHREYRFFMKKNNNGEITKYAVLAGLLATFEDGRESARIVWDGVYDNHDEKDFREFSSEKLPSAREG